MTTLYKYKQNKSEINNKINQSHKIYIILNDKN